MYQYTATIPANAAGGTWTVGVSPLNDTVGNSSAGYSYHPNKLTVTGTTADTAAPVIQSFDFSPKTVDVSTTAATVTATARITDATGVVTNSSSIFRFVSDTTTQDAYCYLRLVEGTTTDGTYQCDAVVPAGSAAGSWTAMIYGFEDPLGNFAFGATQHTEKLTVTSTRLVD